MRGRDGKSLRKWKLGKKIKALEGWTACWEMTLWGRSRVKVDLEDGSGFRVLTGVSVNTHPLLLSSRTCQTVPKKQSLSPLNCLLVRGRSCLGSQVRSLNLSWSPGRGIYLERGNRSRAFRVYVLNLRVTKWHRAIQMPCELDVHKGLISELSRKEFF